MNFRLLSALGALGIVALVRGQNCTTDAAAAPAPAKAGKK